MKKERNKMRDMILGAIFAIALILMVVTCAAHEEQLVKEHCGHLTGYEYGACQMSIY